MARVSTLRFEQPTDRRCQWCGRTLSATTLQKGHEASLTCTARRNTKQASLRGLAPARSGVVEAVAKLLGIAPEPIFDTYRTPTFGRGGRRQTTSYYPAWLVGLLGVDADAFNWSVERAEEQWQARCSAFATALRPALDDLQYRAAVEAAHALGGAEAILRIAKEHQRHEPQGACT